jgi:hypothetical protein
MPVVGPLVICHSRLLAEKFDSPNLSLMCRNVAATIKVAEIDKPRLGWDNNPA